MVDTNFKVLSRNLRRKMTDPETLMWSKLRNKALNVKFWRQYVFDGKYILDFYCPTYKLVIELDGGQHNENEKDRVRDKYLTDRGCKVMRFWNNEVLGNVEGCLEVIAKEVKYSN